jgi:phospholipid/cholesterol/gamma-HCH transport system substrate-binding protein
MKRGIPTIKQSISMHKANNYFEVIVGTFVLGCAAFFLFNSLKSTKVSATGGYHLIAKFENIDGLASGSDVKISGVKIGTVENQFLDEKNFRATLKIMINPNVKLPTDSSAKVSSEGLLGSKYLSITPGGDENLLKEGEEIQFTQSSVNFEDLLGKFIFSNVDKANNKKVEANEK